MKKLKLYVGCGLTTAPPEFRIWVKEELKPKLREHFEVVNFIGLGDQTPDETFEWDIERCVSSCDLHLSIHDFPSDGNGMEVLAAVMVYKKPSLGVAHRNSVVSKLPMWTKNPLRSFERYNSRDDIVRLIQDFAVLHFSQGQLELEMAFH